MDKKGENVGIRREKGWDRGIGQFYIVGLHTIQRFGGKIRVKPLLANQNAPFFAVCSDLAHGKDFFCLFFCYFFICLFHYLFLYFFIISFSICFIIFLLFFI